MKKITPYIPGLAVCGLIGLSAILLAGYIPYLGSVTIALIIGMLLGGPVRKHNFFKPGINFSDKRLLPFTIALLGVELQPKVLFDLGLPAIGLIVGLMGITILSGLLLGQLLGLNRKLSLLLGCGNAVCGSSAIASVSKTIDASEQDAGLSIAAVNFMGTLGIFILPLLALSLGLDDTRSGGLIGGILQAVGQVVAAGYSINPEVGQLAVLIKMGRVLMLGPIIIILSLFYRRSDQQGQSTLPVPLFIVGFFALALLVGLFPAQLTASIKACAKVLLTIAMAGIGLKIDLLALREQGPKIMIAESSIMLIQIGSGIALVMLLF